MKKIYYVECGVLLDKSNEDYNSYDNVFDKKHAFYDESVDFLEDFEIAKKRCVNYIKEGVNGTYGIISEIFVPEDMNRDGYFDELVGDSILYNINNVIYNACKIKNEEYTYPNKNAPIIENFLEKEVV